jgi:hypothetical protein
MQVCNRALNLGIALAPGPHEQGTPSRAAPAFELSASGLEDLRSLRCPVVARHIGAVRGERCYELPDALIEPLFVGIEIVRCWQAKQLRGEVADARVQVGVRKAGKVRRRLSVPVSERECSKRGSSKPPHGCGGHGWRWSP